MIRLDRMQRVHTLIRLALPLTSARTVWMLASKRRGVTLWAWLTLRPTAGPFPHTSQRLAMVIMKVVEIMRTKNPNHTTIQARSDPTRGPDLRRPRPLVAAPATCA